MAAPRVFGSVSRLRVLALRKRDGPTDWTGRLGPSRDRFRDFSRDLELSANGMQPLYDASWKLPDVQKLEPGTSRALQ